MHLNDLCVFFSGDISQQIKWFSDTLGWTDELAALIPTSEKQQVCIALIYLYSIQGTVEPNLKPPDPPWI